MIREMKDSGVEWVGEIPEDWTIRKIKFSLNEHIEKNDPIKSKNILSLTAKQGVIQLSEREGGGNKPKEDFSAYKLTYPGDIVMNSMNIISGSVGLSNYFGCMSPVYYMLRPVHKEDDVRFYNYVFQSKPFQLSLFGLGNGILVKQTDNDKFNTVRLRIPMDKLGDVGIPNISPAEQQQIVHFLDRKCTAIDTAIEKTKKSIEKLEEYKKAVITKAVTRGLNPDAKMKDSGIEWIGEVPETWGVKQLRKFYSRRLNKNKYLQEKNLLSLSYGNIIRKNIDTKEGLLPESFDGYNIVEVDDIVIRGTDLQNDHRSLRTGLVKERGIITSAYMTLKPKAGVNSEYYHYLLHCYDIEKVFYSMGGGLRQSLDYWDFIRTYVLVPSKHEQMDIVNYIHKKCASVDSLIAKKQEAIDKWEEYKKSLIYYAVTGKIDCRNEVVNAES